MNRKSLATRLASGVVQAPWSRDGVCEHLNGRLPQKLTPLAADFSRQIVGAHETVAPPYKVVADRLRGSGAFEALYRFCLAHDVWPQPVVTAPAMRPAPAFMDLTVPRLCGVADLCEWLGLDVDRMKAAVHALGQDGVDDPLVLARLRGQVEWVAQLNPQRGAKLMAKLVASAR